MELCNFINEAFNKGLGVYYIVNKSSYVIFKDVSYKIHLTNKKVSFLIMLTKYEDKIIRRFINDKIKNDEGVFDTCEINNGDFIV